MPNPPAISHDTVYHIFNRGNNRENIFVEERNYAYFMDLYIKHVAPIAETFAYCLLRNHFHLLVRIQTPKVLDTLGVPFPSRRFSNFFNAYAKTINYSYNRTGSLFQHPFRRIPVQDDAYFLRVVRYIHRNPQKHGFVDDFRDWPYSSFFDLLSVQPTFLARNTVLEMCGGRQEFIRFVVNPSGEDLNASQVFD